jgi:hypothetical protein
MQIKDKGTGFPFCSGPDRPEDLDGPLYGLLPIGRE